MIEPGAGIKIVYGFQVDNGTTADIYACDTICYYAVFVRLANCEQTLVSAVITDVGKTPVIGCCDSLYLLIFDEVDILVTVIDEENRIIMYTETSAAILMYPGTGAIWRWQDIRSLVVTGFDDYTAAALLRSAL
jgi:hypothetical protein